MKRFFASKGSWVLAILGRKVAYATWLMLWGRARLQILRWSVQEVRAILHRSIRLPAGRWVC